MSSLTNAQAPVTDPVMIAPTERPGCLMRMKEAANQASALYCLVKEAIALTHEASTVSSLRALLIKVEVNELALRTTYLEADRAYRLQWEWSL